MFSCATKRGGECKQPRHGARQAYPVRKMHRCALIYGNSHTVCVTNSGGVVQLHCGDHSAQNAGWCNASIRKRRPLRTHLSSRAALRGFVLSSCRYSARKDGPPRVVTPALQVIGLRLLGLGITTAFGSKIGSSVGATSYAPFFFPSLSLFSSMVRACSVSGISGMAVNPTKAGRCVIDGCERTLLLVETNATFAREGVNRERMQKRDGVLATTAQGSSHDRSLRLGCAGRSSIHASACGWCKPTQTVVSRRTGLSWGNNVRWHRSRSSVGRATATTCRSALNRRWDGADGSRSLQARQR